MEFSDAAVAASAVAAPAVVEATTTTATTTTPSTPTTTTTTTDIIVEERMIRLLLFASQFCTSFANAIWSFSIVIVLSWLGNHQPTTTLAETMGNNETVWIMNASGTVDKDAHHEVGVAATTTAATTTTTEQAQDEDDTDPGSFFLVSAFGLVTGLALILGSEPVGAWFDARIRPPPPPNTDSSSSSPTGVMTPRRRQPRQRNHALGILLVGQGLCLLMCGSLTAVAVATTTTNGGLLSWIHSSQHYTRPYQILLALMICLLGASAEVLRQTINIAAIQKDLVVAMTMSTKRIRTSNTESRIQQRAQWLSSPTTTTDTCSIVNDKKNNNINNNHKEEGQDDDEDAPPPPNQLQQQSQPHYQYSAHEQHWLTHVNVIMRQLDLICKILGPVVAGWFLKDLSSSSSSSSGADDSNDTDGDDDDDNNNNNRTRTIMIWIPLLTASCSVVLIALQSMFLNQLFVRTPSLQYSSSNPIVDDNNDDDEPPHIRTEEEQEEDDQDENEWDDEGTESQEQHRQQHRQQQEQREFEFPPSRSDGGDAENDCTYPQDEEDSGNCCFLERRRRRKRVATTLHKLEQDEEDDFQLLPGSLFSSYCICCRPLMTTFGCSSSSTTEYCRMPLAAVGAGLALAFLYLNPLSLNDPLVVPYLLLKTNLTATSLGLWEGCNNLFGFVGTLAFWVATSTLSATTDRTLPLTNLYSVAFFFLCITVTYASLWCVEAAHSDSNSNNDDDGTKDSDASSSSSSSLSASSWPVWILAGSLCLSRSALWAFDLSVNQTIQEAVVRDSLAQRARIGSIQNSLQAIFDCLQYALGCIASNPNQFVPILATIGYGTVGFAVVLVWIVLPPPTSSLEVESQRGASPHSSLSNGVALAWCRCRQWICGNRVSLSLQTHPPHGKWQFVSGTEEQGEEEDLFVNELTIPHTAATRRSSFQNYSSCNHHHSS